MSKTTVIWKIPDGVRVCCELPTGKLIPVRFEGDTPCTILGPLLPTSRVVVLAPKYQQDLAANTASLIRRRCKQRFVEVRTEQEVAGG